jgi:photosynthetic reaction center cytochrome c subunit
MLQDFMRNWAIATTILGAVGLVIVGALAQSAASPASKTAGETFKNIQILKDMPADQLMPTMGFISASLGVGCDHCHVPGSFEKDDKKPKLFAREMMKMMFTINQNNFEGKREVTCYSCHHGGVTPTAIPVIPAEETKPEKPVPLPQVTADQVLDKYAQAVGGADALQKISSRVSKGKATVFGGHQFPVEVLVKSPDKWASYLHLPPGDNATVYDGHGGWMSAPGRPSRELGVAEIDAIKFDADLQFPLTAKKTFSEMKVSGTE